jgi:hypothetical protein
MEGTETMDRALEPFMSLIQCFPFELIFIIGIPTVKWSAEDSW